MIIRSSGTHFDPAIIESFIELADQFQAITHALTDGAGEPGSASASDTVSMPPLELAHV
jgi:hypothetical protein